MFNLPWRARPVLGALERQIMEVVWAGGDLTVRDVQQRLARPMAYTTVMTTLDRLYKKGLVSRARSGRAFVYAAAQNVNQAEAALADGVLKSVLARRPSAALPIFSNLVDAVGEGEHAEDVLTRLETLVRDKRRQLKGGL